MSPGDAVLAIDQGTSGTKAIVVDADGAVLGVGHADVRPDYGRDGAVEQDPDALYASVLDAGARALREAGVRVARVGLANQGETVLAWDRRTGGALGPAIVWQDRRSLGVCEELAHHTDMLRDVSGLPLDPYFAAPKMSWIRRHQTTDGVVTTSDAWLLHRLSGAFITDVSTASRTMLMDLDHTAWSSTALDAFSLSDADLPEIVDCTGEFAETTAFGAPMTITGLLVDQQAALLAHGCTRRGATKCTYGTGAFVLTNTGDEPVRSAGGLVPSVAWRLGDALAYCLDGQVFTVASAVRWLVDLGVVNDASELDDVARTVSDAGGVTFVPSFAGLAAPWWRGDVRATLQGLGLETSRGHIVRALFEGIAAQVVAMVDAAGASTNAPLDRLQVDGGLSQSATLMQVQADLLQRPVEVLASSDATAHGVALAATWADRAAHGAETNRAGVLYEPSIDASRAAEVLERHRRAISALVEVDAP